MNYWLVKTEPDKYGWHHFTEQGRAVWDGVRNYQARNNLNAMRLGDSVLFYHSVTNPGRSESRTSHSGVPAGAVVGLARVVREAYSDPTAPAESNAAPARWVAVQLEPVLAFERPVSRAQIRTEPLLANIALLRQSRLSVMPIRPDEFELILKLGTHAVMNDER